ncbi:MAG: GTPase Era [Chloroflexi bacterium]|nr:GTPase Era [Chloroflexota bacterium]
MEEKAYKSGFVALLGRPNAGKSTLLNYFLQQKIAAVSPRPQTTRRRQLGILTTEDMQIIFMDTPGVHRAVHKLGEYMNEEALATLEDADVLLWLFDLTEPMNEDDEILSENMQKVSKLPPVILLMNKVDLVTPVQAAQRQAEYQRLMPGAPIELISSKRGDGIPGLLKDVEELLPKGPHYYEEDQITDLYEREIAIDLIRAAALIHLRDEVPHEMAVRLEDYEDRSGKAAYISATLLVNRETHKGIVIGKEGAMLKTIGSEARKQIEELTGRKVFLELHVKVSKNWRDNPELLGKLGYVTRPQE